MPELFSFQGAVQLNLESEAFKKNSELKKKMVARFGKDKMHLIKTVIDVSEEDTKENFDHPQKIIVLTDTKKEAVSGAFFKRYTPKEEPPHLQAFNQMCCKKNQQS